MVDSKNSNIADNKANKNMLEPRWPPMPQPVMLSPGVCWVKSQNTGQSHQCIFSCHNRPQINFVMFQKSATTVVGSGEDSSKAYEVH